MRVEKKIFRVLREINGFTNAEIAEKVRLSKGAISQIERSKYQVRERMLEDYAKIFGVNAEFIKEHTFSPKDESYIEYVCRVSTDAIEYMRQQGTSRINAKTTIEEALQQGFTVEEIKQAIDSIKPDTKGVDPYVKQ